MTAPSPRGAPSGGLLDSLRQFGHTLLDVLHTRAGIVAAELEEARLRVEQFLLLAVAAGFCLSVAMLLAVAFLVVLLWNTHPLAAIGIPCLLCIAGGVVAALKLRHAIATRPRLFETTVGELAKDREALARRP